MNAKQLIEAATRVGPIERGWTEESDAAFALAQHILVTVREDDDEPVTRERLEADGWYWDRVSQEWRLQSDDDPNGDHCIMPQGKFFYWSGGMIGRYLKSMGQLRRLVAALGE